MNETYAYFQHNFLSSLIITLQILDQIALVKATVIIRYYGIDFNITNKTLNGKCCHDIQIQHHSSQENISTKRFRVALRVYVGSARKLATTFFTTFRFPRCHCRGRAGFVCGTTVHRHSVKSTRYVGVRVISPHATRSGTCF